MNTSNKDIYCDEGLVSLESFFSIPDLAVLALDKKKRVWRANDFFVNMAGISVDNITGKHIDEIIDDRLKSEVDARFVPYVGCGGEHVGSICLFFKKNVKFHAKAGHLTNKLREKTKELSDISKHYQTLFKSIPVPLFIWRFSDENLVLTDFNDLAFKNSNGKVSEFIGESAKDLYHDNDKLLVYMEQSRKEKEILHCELSYKCPFSMENSKKHIIFNYAHPDILIMLTIDILEYDDDPKEYSQQWPFNIIDFFAREFKSVYKL